MTSESESVTQYSALASIYDQLMIHVHYEEWLILIKRIIQNFFIGNLTPRILEIGAGTGVLGHNLSEMGFRYTGSDISCNMCKHASLKNLPTICLDGRKLPLKRKFDLILFLYDGINYLQSPNDYLSLFTEVENVLEPGGLFLFDITTQINSLNNFSDYLDFEDYGEFSYVRHSYYNKKSSIQYNDFTIYKKSEQNPDLYKKFLEHHIQKVFPVRAVEKMIPRTLYEIEGIWDGYSFNKYSDYSDRVHFLLRKRKKS